MAGLIEAGGDFTVQAGGDIVVSGVAAEGMLDARAEIKVAGEIDLHAQGELRLAEATLLEAERITVAAGDMVLDGEARADVSLSATATDTLLVAGDLQAGDVGLDTGSISLRAGSGDLILSGQAQLAAGEISLTSDDARLVQAETAAVSAKRLAIESRGDLALNLRGLDQLSLALSDSDTISITHHGALQVVSLVADATEVSILNFGDLTLSAIDLSEAHEASLSVEARTGLTALPDGYDLANPATLPNGAFTPVLLTVGDIDGVSTLILESGGALAAAGTLSARLLDVRTAGDTTLTTAVDRLRVALDFGNLTITQSTGDLVAERIALTIGDLTLTAQGDLILNDLSRDLSVASASAAGADFTGLLGVVRLTSETGRIVGFGGDESLIMADELILRAATGIDDLNVAVHKLGVHTGSGNLTLRNQQLEGANFDGLILKEAIIDTGGVLNIAAQGDLILQADAKVKAQDITLQSEQGNITVALPTDWVDVSHDSIHGFDSLSLIATEGIVDLYRLIASATDRLEYRASGFQFGADDDSKTTRFVGDLSAAEVIIESVYTGSEAARYGSALLIEGDIHAAQRVRLITDQNLMLQGNVRGLAPATSVARFEAHAYGKHEMQIVRVEAGSQEAQDLEALTDLTGLATEARPTGHISILAQDLAIDRFDLRAGERVYIATESDLTVFGTIVGLHGLDAVAKLRFDVMGVGGHGAAKLTFVGGVYNASESIEISADTVSMDHGSMLKAPELVLRTQGDATLNTYVERLDARVHQAGDFTLTQASDLVIDRLVVSAGDIDIQAKGALDVRDMRLKTNTVNNTVNIVALKDLGVERIDAVAADITLHLAGELVRPVGAVEGVVWGRTVTINSPVHYDPSTGPVLIISDAAPLNAGTSLQSVIELVTLPEHVVGHYVVTLPVALPKSLTGEGTVDQFHSHNLTATGTIWVTDLVLGAGQLLNLTAGEDIELPGVVTSHDSLVTLIAADGHIILPDAVDLGADGELVMVAGALSVGGKLTAGGLSITVDQDLDLETEVSRLDLNIGIEATIVINEQSAITGGILNLAGGSFTINTVDGDLRFDRLANRSGHLQLSSNTGFAVDGHLATGAAGISIDVEGALSLTAVTAGELVFDGVTGVSVRFDNRSASTLTLKGGIDAGSDELALITDSLDITAAAGLRSAGGDLILQTASQGRTIQLGGSGAENALSLSNDELAKLESGFGTIRVGDTANQHQTIAIGTADGEGDVVFLDALEIINDGEGGEIVVRQNLVGTSLTVFGSGSTTELAGNITMEGDILYEDSIRVIGDVVITSETGRIQLGGQGDDHYLAAHDRAADSTLTLLLGAGGNVDIYAEIGASSGTDPVTGLLKGLTIGTAEQPAGTVTFHAPVGLAGDMVIHAAHIVGTDLLFALGGGDLTLTAPVNASSLRIREADSVVFGGAVSLSGNGDQGHLQIEANTLTIMESVTGHGGEFILTATDDTRDIRIGVADKAPSVLDLTVAEVNRITGFATWHIGHANFDEDAGWKPNAAASGNVIVDGEALELTRVTLYGKDVEVGRFNVTEALAIIATGEVSQLDTSALSFNPGATLALDVGGDASLIIDGALALAASDVRGALDLTASGDITQTGAIVIGGATTLVVSGFDITLYQADNDFIGAVSVTARDLTLRDRNALEMGESALSRNLLLSVSGDITQSGALSVQGTTILTLFVDADIILDDADNDFVGAVSASARDLTLADAGDLKFDFVVLDGNLRVEVGGGITQDRAIFISGTTILTAEGDITLTNLANRLSGEVAVSAHALDLAVDQATLALVTTIDVLNLTTQAEGTTVTVAQTGDITGGLLKMNAGSLTISISDGDDARFNGVENTSDTVLLSLTSDVSLMLDGRIDTGAGLNLSTSVGSLSLDATASDTLRLVDVSGALGVSLHNHSTAALEIGGEVRAVTGDLLLRSDRVTLEPTATLVGSGDLLLQTYTEGRTIVLGGAPVLDDTTLIIDAVELTRLQHGFARIVIGDASAQDVHVGVASGNTGATFRDDLVIDNGAGILRVLETLTGTTLTTYAGAGTTVLAADVVLSGDLTHGASLRVAGERSVTVGDDIVLGDSEAQFIAADSTAVAGILHLVLTDQGDVTLHAEIGRGPVDAGTDLLTALTITGGRIVSFNEPVEIRSGLSIEDVDSVYFRGEVRLAGDLVIRAENEVKFDQEVTLTNGGRLDVVARDVDTSLLNMVFRLEGGDFVIDADTVANSITILDANSVLIQGSLTLTRGDLVVQANEFALGDGAVVLSDNNAALVIVALYPSRDVAFGVDVKNPHALSVTKDELNRLQGFGQWQLGHALVDEDGDLQPNPDATGSVYFADSGERLELDLLRLLGREIILDDLELVGDLRIDATFSVIQGGVLDVDGLATFNGSTVVLGNAANRFGIVEVNAVTLDLAGRIGGTLQADVSGAMTQSAPLQVGGTSRITAGSVNLDNAGNSFGEVMTLTAGEATVRAGGTLNVVLATGATTLDASAVVMSGSAGTLVATAGSITQGGTLSVSGQTTLNGGTVTLGNGGNSFGGGVVRASTLDLAGRIGGTLQADVSGAMTQSAPLQVGGTSRITAGSVNLDNAGNSFGGVMTLTAGEATVHAESSLTVDLDISGDARFDATGSLVLGGFVGGSLLGSGTTGIGQFATLVVAGNVALASGGDIVLMFEDNDFGGLLELIGRNVSVFDRDDLRARIEASGEANLGAGGNLGVDGLMGEDSLLTLELTPGEDGRIWVGEIVSGGVVRLLSDGRPVLSALGPEQTNIVAGEVYIEAAPLPLPDVKGRVADKLALLRPELMKIEANRISGITHEGRLYSVFDPVTGDTYLIALKGREAFVYFVSIGNVADMREMVHMHLNLVAFDIIFSGGSAPILMGENLKSPPTSMALLASARMDSLAKQSRDSGVLKLRAMLGMQDLMLSLHSDINSVFFDAGFMQSLVEGLTLGFNLNYPYVSNKVVNYYGDFQFWSTGQEQKDFFTYDFYEEEEFEF